MRRRLLWTTAGLTVLGFFYLTALPGSLLHPLRLGGASELRTPAAVETPPGPAGPEPAPLPPEAERPISTPRPPVADPSPPQPEGVGVEEPGGRHTLDDGSREEPARADRAGGGDRPVSGPPVRVMTFNIRHALGVDGLVSLGRVADAVAGAEIVFLSEVDRFWLRSGLRDQPAVLQELTGLPYAYFAPALDLPGPSRQYGNLLLSRFPILEASAVPLPRRQGSEARVMIEARLDVHGEVWSVFGVHLGLDRDERRRQVEAVAERAAGGGPWRILLGDFNATVDAPELGPVVNAEGPGWVDGLAGAPATYPAWSPTARIDHIFLSPALAARRQAAGVDRHDASDHLPAWVELRLNGSRPPVRPLPGLQP